MHKFKLSLGLIFLFWNLISYAQPYLDLMAPVLEKKVNVKASISEVWEAWTTVDGLQNFLASECKMELRPGGPFEVYFMPYAEEGQKGTEHCTVLSYVPEEMFSFTWNAPPKFPELRALGPTTWVVINFTTLGKGQVEVRLRHFGWQEGKEWIQLHDYFDLAWDSVLLWLKEALESE